MKSKFELYDVKLKKNSALAYVRDIKDEHVIEPVALKRDFGEKLSTKLGELRSADDAKYGNLAKSVNGRLKGVITKDADGYGHVDWSTVNIEDMKPIDTEGALYKKPNFIKANLKRNSVYGDFATGNIRESKAGDAAILKLSNMEGHDGIDVLADGRKALAEGSVLPVANEALFLSFESSKSLFETLAKNEFGDDFKYTPEFSQLTNLYMNGITDVSSGEMVIHEVNGSVVDMIDDIKHFTEENDVSVDEFFKSQQNDSKESRTLNEKYEDYVVEHATDRVVKLHYISNLTFEKKVPDENSWAFIEQQVSGFDDLIMDDDSVRKYANELTAVGSGVTTKSPYDIRESLAKVEPKDVRERHDKFHDDVDMEF